MPHKIILTGKATSSLRCEGQIYSFDMRESGSSSAPKGLPVSTDISYTVFANKKQLQKANITDETIKTEQLLVQGEPTLDISVDRCPGEIAVIAFQLQIIDKKQKKDLKAPKEQKEEKKVIQAPKGTSDFLYLEEIVIPDKFLNAYPRKEKLDEKMKYLEENGTIDQPLLVHSETKLLQDGYSRYIAAKEMKEKKVPVRYVEQKVFQ
ncbi:plasmid stabilization protein [Halalkalibacter alkalisediminis]|jgi:hypothetical protein|uniref:Plasmid stabilization protein n=1 Tax=Halalkalibacter alkalisediminis TaxID=935616 RepID=A0ABV6NJ39_9BACI|nr:plasmid stabilization protein [Halalkalibacter alkalisediminis]